MGVLAGACCLATAVLGLPGLATGATGAPSPVVTTSVSAPRLGNDDQAQPAGTTAGSGTGDQANTASRLDNLAAMVQQSREDQLAAASGSAPVLGPEILSQATAYTSTYQGGSGSLWSQYSQVPVNYQDSAGAWHAIDTTLHPDPGVAGGLVSGANTWQVHFSPLGTGGGVTLDSGGKSVTFVPQGANAVSPQVDPADPSRVIYKGAWDGADLEYTVSSVGVEEDILINSASAPTTYDFSTPGTSLGSPGSSLPGQGAGLPLQWSFHSPVVTDHRGNNPNGAGQALTARAGGAQVSVSPSWLAKEPASAFPIDLDPSITYGGVPPWNWNGVNAAVFCMNSTGYTGHPAGGPYTTCTLPSGYVGAKVGRDGNGVDWETELAFDVPDSTTLSEPSGCTTTTVGTPSQNAKCIVVLWAQLGLGLGPTGQGSNGAGYLNVFGGTAAFTYGSVGPYVLVANTAATGSQNQDTNTLRARSSQSFFPCEASSGQVTNLGDFYQKAVCGTGGYLTLGESSSTGGTGTSSSTVPTCIPSTGGNCGPYQSFQYLDLFVNYSYAPLAPGQGTATVSGNNVTLSITPAESQDPAPDNDALKYNFLMTGSDGSAVQSTWTSATSWQFPVSPGVSYTWQALVEDPHTVVVPNWKASFAGPGGSGQAAPELLTTPGGYPVGTDIFGGYNPSGNCPCTSPTTNGPYEVSPGNGDLVETSQDLSIAGAGLPLGLSRTYDSGLAQLQASSGGPAPGPLGYGWSYNLGMSLSVNPSTQVATVDQENGSEISFSPYAAGSSPSWCIASFNYCANDARVLGTLEHNSNGTWTFQRDTTGQTTFSFSSSGTLQSESDAAGDVLTSSSEAAGTGACPSAAASCTVWTSSASGRALTLAFDSSGRLLSATAASAPASLGAADSVFYCYFGQSCANGASGGGANDLYSATLAGSVTTTDAYDITNSNTSLRHDILTEGLPSGGTVTNTYNSSGQVVAQSAPSGNVALSYSGNAASYQQPGSNGVPAGSTLVSYQPAGSQTAQETNYQYSSGALVAETTGYGTSQAATQYLDLNQNVFVPTTVQTNAPAGETSVETTTNALSTSGPLSAADVTLSTDAMGNTTERQYNSYNQAWCTVAPAEYLAGVRCQGTSISAVGSPAKGTGTALSVSPQTAGDLMVLTVGRASGRR